MGHPRWISAAAGLVILLGQGCVFSKSRQDIADYEAHAKVSGEVTVTGYGGAPIVIAAGRLPNDPMDPMEIYGAQVLLEPGAFSMRLPAGSYVIGTFEDVNENQHWDLEERGSLGKTMDIERSETISRVKLRIDKSFGRPHTVDRYPLIEGYEFSRGEVVPLSDARFSETLAKKAMWEPTKLAKTERPGIYMLHAFDPTKTPVLYVHGMAGYPQQFETLIRSLDSDRFQPWVLLYPSGFALDQVSRAVHLILNELEVKYDYARMCVVAHSAGGLLARGLIGEHTKGVSEPRIRGLVTLASPLGGMPSAGMGVKMAPVAVPAWYDLAPGSKFLERLYDPPLPKSVEYHLLFAYDGNGASDGTVPTPRQLRWEAQDEAEVVRGYAATHVGILKSKSAIAQVAAALDRCAGVEGTPRIAPRVSESGVEGTT